MIGYLDAEVVPACFILVGQRLTASHLSRSSYPVQDTQPLVQTYHFLKTLCLEKILPSPFFVPQNSHARAIPNTAPANQLTKILTMAVDPTQAAMIVQPRFHPNISTTILGLTPNEAQAHLLHSATRLVQKCPPSLPWASPYPGNIYRGLFTGPSSIAYFFYALSLKQPALLISGHTPSHWSAAYLSFGQDSVPASFEDSCGITNEYLVYNTLAACLHQEDSYARKVLAALKGMQDVDPSWCEWLKGRAGALYLLRLLKNALPHLTPEIDLVITQLIEDILPEQPWVWSSRQYLGPVHGEIGILTQIILSDPSYAARLESKLGELLDAQQGDGNWPVIPGKDIGLVQFCHGAPGFVISLLAIRTYFLNLHNRIDEAIAKARTLVWEQGVLTKEPNLCHGIHGNALALEGEQREHFMCLARPMEVESGLENGRFDRDKDPFGVLWGEAGRAWLWMDWIDGELKEPEGRCALYTDV